MSLTMFQKLINVGIRKGCLCFKFKQLQQSCLTLGITIYAWPTWSIVISSRSSAILETSKPLKSLATAHARITKSLFQHFKCFTSRFTQSHTELDAHLCSSTSAISPISENRRRLMQYTHKDTCNNQTFPHATTPLGAFTHKTPPQHTLAGNSWTTSDLRVMSTVLGLLDTPSYSQNVDTRRS